MKFPIKISSSILFADYGNLESCVRAAEEGGMVVLKYMSV